MDPAHSLSSLFTSSTEARNKLVDRNGNCVCETLKEFFRRNTGKVLFGMPIKIAFEFWTGLDKDEHHRDFIAPLAVANGVKRFTESFTDINYRLCVSEVEPHGQISYKEDFRHGRWEDHQYVVKLIFTLV